MDCAALRWARTDISLLRAYAQFAGIFAVLVPILFLGLLFT